MFSIDEANAVAWSLCPIVTTGSAVQLNVQAGEAASKRRRSVEGEVIITLPSVTLSTRAQAPACLLAKRTCLLPRLALNPGRPGPVRCEPLAVVQSREVFVGRDRGARRKQRPASGRDLRRKGVSPLFRRPSAARLLRYRHLQRSHVSVDRQGRWLCTP